MNKTEMIKVVANKTGYTQKDVAAVVDAMVATVVDTVASGDDVRIAGFGTFGVTERAAREGINPQTKEKIQIAATKSPKFKASSSFKDAVKA